MNTWDVILLRFPFGDGTDVKKRPAVVISKNEYHNSGQDGLFLLVTSNLDRSAHYDVPIPVSHPEYRFTGLRVASCIRVDKIMNLSNTLVVRTLGNLGEGLKREVREKLAELIKI
jgi:mRNA interferase MazF